jgi:glycosyltransferase involved in cell wall biosynthesis
LGELPDAELPVLYNLAEVFVLPSHWEGFGLPILEAMACGTPVIASNRTSLPEIAGGAALLFESTQVDALSGLIYNVLTDAELQTQMSEDGLRQAARFSWEMTAEETMQIYKRVLS